MSKWKKAPEIESMLKSFAFIRMWECGFHGFVLSQQEINTDDCLIN